MSEQMYTIVLILGMVVIMYFLMIRPERKRKKEKEALQNSLTVGDEITTIGGIVGTICAMKENTVVIESSADRVRIEITKWAIADKGITGGNGR